MIKRLMVFLGLVLMSWTLQANDEAVQRLYGYLQQMQSLEGHFQQLTRDPRGQRLQEAEGRMSLQKPGRFYWHTEQPFVQLLVSNGEVLWIYDPDLEQVTVQPVDQRTAQTPAVILSGESTDLARHFNITYTRQGDVDAFRLLPKQGEDTLFEVLWLYFLDGRIHALQLEDSLGQQTRVDLQIEGYNQPVDATRFSFEIPDGVDVIQE